MTCVSCKWYRIGHDKGLRQKMNLSENEVREHCAACLAQFKESLLKKPRTCLTCEWKDRNLPFEARKLRCDACAETFATHHTTHKCDKCPWNDATRRMPTDATLAHCKACAGVVGGSTAMSCASCRWHEMPEDVRRAHCVACSLKFAGNKKVKFATNELSNGGQMFISFDNHNPEMTDDRDVVTQIRREYVESLKSKSSEGTAHPIFNVADRMNMTIEEFAEEAYEKMKRFLYEFSQLTDMQALLFLSEVKGCDKHSFAKNHHMSDTAVNMLYKQLLVRSTIFKDFIILSNGSLKGKRGRKAKNGTLSLAKIPKSTKKIVYAGIFQPTFGL